MSLTEIQKAIEDKLEVLDILKEGWSYTGYNPVANYHHIAFDIYDEEAFKKVDRWLHPAKYEIEDKENAESKL